VANHASYNAIVMNTANDVPVVDPIVVGNAPIAQCDVV
jgi:hypothetical protein